MWMRALKYLAVTGTLCFAGLQVLPRADRTNPAVVPGHSLQVSTPVPESVKGVLRRACMDCHSHETRWPWYSHVAPLSWGMTSDVARARKAMNLSEWTTQSGRSPVTSIGILTAMCAGVKSGRMPLPKYALLHPEARLTDEDRKAVCDWTAIEIERQIAIKKRDLVSQGAR
jgi:hypothetical protein